MKTAPFDLDLAKLGHPLITSNGRKVVDFHTFDVNISWPVRAVLCGLEELHSFDNSGKSFMRRTGDLLLDLETPWEKPFKFLEEVLVKDSPKAEWRLSYFVYHYKGNGSFVIRTTKGYLETVSFCKRPEPIVEDKTTLDVEIKVGGQPVSLDEFKKLVNKL